MTTSCGGKILVRLNAGLLREGLLAVLEGMPDLTVRESDGTLASVVSPFPDIAIVDIFDKEFISLVRESCDSVIVPVVTAVLPAEMLAAYTETIGIYDSPATIGVKLRSLLETQSVGTADRSSDDLSPREREVILGIVKGLSNKEIASEMHVSVNTVMTHRRNIAAKLQIHSAAGLTIYAITTGLVDIEEIKNSSFI